ncbi:MAG: hypothetical protein ACK4N5_10095 [Myxococcales bacterium]
MSTLAMMKSPERRVLIRDLALFGGLSAAAASVVTRELVRHFVASADVYALAASGLVAGLSPLVALAIRRIRSANRMTTPLGLLGGGASLGAVWGATGGVAAALLASPRGAEALVWGAALGGAVGAMQLGLFMLPWALLRVRRKPTWWLAGLGASLAAGTVWAGMYSVLGVFELLRWLL